MIPETVALDHLAERIEPDYPEDARAQRLQGTVIVDMVAGKDGEVEGLSLVDGDPRFLASAVKALRRWRFNPLIRYGHPVSFETHITVHFALP